MNNLSSFKRAAIVSTAIITSSQGANIMQVEYDITGTRSVLGEETPFEINFSFDSEFQVGDFYLRLRSADWPGPNAIISSYQLNPIDDFVLNYGGHNIGLANRPDVRSLVYPAHGLSGQEQFTSHWHMVDSDSYPSGHHVDIVQMRLYLEEDAPINQVHILFEAPSDPELAATPGSFIDNIGDYDMTSIVLLREFRDADGFNQIQSGVHTAEASFVTTVIPEPSTTLLSLGAAGFFLGLRRRQAPSP